MIITNSRYAPVGYFITSYPTRAHGIIVKYFPIFKTARDSIHLGRKYPRIFVLGYYLFLEAHSFPRATLQKTVRFSELTMSADKYPSICSRQTKAIVFLFFIQNISPFLIIKTTRIIDHNQLLLTKFGNNFVILNQ